MNIREATQLFIKKELSPEANAARLIDAAKAGLQEAIKSGKASSQFETIVDGIKNAAIEAAKKSIVFRFSYMGDVADFALYFLHDYAYAGGKFSKSFWVSVDGRYLPPGTFGSRNVPVSAEIVIGNTQPYARRIDVNMVGNRVLKYTQGKDIYISAIDAIKKKYGNLVNVKRVWDYNFPGKYKQVHEGYHFSSPAIIISPNT